VPRPAFPKTLREFQSKFGTEEACQQYLAECRWPDGFVCPKCAEVRLKALFPAGGLDSQTLSPNTRPAGKPALLSWPNYSGERWQSEPLAALPTGWALPHSPVDLQQEVCYPCSRHDLLTV
jgi:Transposase zinc-ribbon domain